ncbi:hypothetical protein M426DRAFT_25984 [Hypoxylon sp. CI-4A]|nr:hypothetical protein M426DRAFT_25984 [Hypoxylon sp. CI-4A]
MSSQSGIDLCQVPALAPPDGVTSNFIDPWPTLESTVVGFTIAMTVLSTLFVAGKIYVNWGLLRISDHCAMVALALDVTLSGLMLTKRKFLRHQWDVPSCWFNGNDSMMAFIIEFIMPLAHSFSKLAILLLLLQIFGINKKMRIAISVCIALTIITYWPSFVLVPLLAAPRVGETWDELTTDPRTLDMNYLSMIQGTLGLLIDIYIFILPLPVLASLHMDSSKRQRLFGVFGLGLASSNTKCLNRGVLASIGGLIVRVLLLRTKDATWSSARLYICLVAEMYAALIVACMPALAKLMRRHIPGSTYLKSIGSKLSSSLGYWSKSGSREERYGSSGRGAWWKFAAGKAQGSDNLQEDLSRFHWQTNPLGTGYYELSGSARFDSVQTETSTAPAGTQSSEFKQGITVTKTYGFDKVQRHDFPSENAGV